MIEYITYYDILSFCTNSYICCCFLIYLKFNQSTTQFFLQDWKKTSVAEQKKIPAHEKPKLVLEDISLKMQALDREVKYLINKAKTWKPKSKPKASKTNKTTSNNDTVPEADDIAGEKTEDIPAEDETAEEVKEQKEEKSSKTQKGKLCTSC